MNWEALAALSTAFTGVVILLTAIYAARQVQVMKEQARATTLQLEHFRKSFQLEGMHEIFDQLLTQELSDAYSFVIGEFEERMKDAAYRAEALSRGSFPSPQHKEFIIFRTFESVGTCVKFGMIEGEPLYDFAGPTITMCWKKLEGLINTQRVEWGNPAFWENFEMLARNAQAWLDKKRGGVTAPN